MKDPLGRKNQLEATLLGFPSKNNQTLVNAQTDRYPRRSEILVYVDKKALEQTKIKTPQNPFKDATSTAIVVTGGENYQSMRLEVRGCWDDSRARQSRDKGNKRKNIQRFSSFADLPHAMAMA